MRESHITSEITTSEEYFLHVPDNNGSTAIIPLGSREDTVKSYLDDAAAIPLTSTQLEGALDTLADNYLARQLASRRFVTLRRGVTAASLAASGGSIYEGVTHDSVGFLIASGILAIGGVASHFNGERSIASEKNVRRWENIKYREQVVALTGLINQAKNQNHR